MAEVLVTSDARSDLADIDVYLATEAGERTAKAYAGRFATALRRLADWPGSGPPRPALGPDTRIVVIWPFLMIYDHDQANDRVVVLRILHGRRHISERLLRR